MMPRTMTPRGTASQCGRSSIGITWKRGWARSSSRRWNSLERRAWARALARRGQRREYMTGDASLPRQFGGT